MNKTNVWERVKAMEEQDENDSSTLATLVETMIVNFGEGGTCQKNLIHENMKPLTMFIVICEWYEKEIIIVRKWEG